MIINKKQKQPTLIIASNNEGKVKEFKDLLIGFPFEIKAQPKDFNIKETGNTFLDNARIKANQTAKIFREICLADDSGLCVEALGGSPGIYSARYASSDEQRISRLLQELSENENRSALFKSAICISSPTNGVLIEVEGVCNGTITDLDAAKALIVKRPKVGGQSIKM